MHITRQETKCKPAGQKKKKKAFPMGLAWVFSPEAGTRQLKLAGFDARTVYDIKLSSTPAACASIAVVEAFNSFSTQTLLY